MTVSAAEPTAVRTTLAGDLLLARLLPPTKRPPAPRDVRDAVGRFFRQPLADETWQKLLDELAEAGMLTTGPLRLTDAGRSRALEFLGVGELPTRCPWKTIRAKYLVAKALGFGTTAAEARKRMGRAENLAALVLQRRFELPGGANLSLNDALTLLCFRELGFPEATTLAEVKRLVLSRRIGSESPLNDKELKKHLPRVLLGAKRGGLDGLRDAVLDGWADAAPSPPSPVPPGATPPAPTTATELTPAEFDLPAFAATVKAAARDCPTGRFGDNKVFISHVWRRLRDEPGFPPMDLPMFKERLAEANNARLLTLSRADLVEVMDPADVQESLTGYLNAEFHFVLVEKEQP
jgi:hypothetical protein